MSKHPGFAELQGFLDGDLGADRRTEVDAHIEFCAECQTVLERLTAHEGEAVLPVLFRTSHEAEPPVRRERAAGQADSRNGQASHPAWPRPTTAGLEEADCVELGMEIGRGGVGAVFRSRDQSLKRDMAVKVLLPEHRGDASLERRFLEEAQVTGQLQHPGIVPIYEQGRLPDGRPYFTMKLVQGQTLATLLAQRPEPTQDLMRFLAIFAQVCQTMA